MATGAHFQINQAANSSPTGTTDIARTDIYLSQVMHFVGDSSSGQTSPAWTIVAWPPGATRNQTTNASTFDASYTAATPGSYKVQFLVGDGIGTNKKEFVFRVTKDANGLLIDQGVVEPAFGEEVGNDNSASNDRGYAPTIEAYIPTQVPQIATMANLMNARSAKHKQVHLVGYYSYADGGGGLFVWDGAATYTHDGGRIIQPGFGTGAAMATGRWIRQAPATQYDAAWYGFATSQTGTTNVAAVMAAVSAASTAGGGTVRLPAGTFPWKVPSNGSTTGTFYLANISNVCIIGAGMDHTILLDQQSPSAVNDFSGNGNGKNAFITLADASHIRIRDLQLHGAAIYQQSAINLGGVTSREGITFSTVSTGPNDCVAEWVKFSHLEGEAFVAQAASGKPAKDVVARFCYFYRCIDNAININTGVLDGSYRCGGHHNRIEDVSGAHFEAGGTDLWFENNVSIWTGVSENPGTDGAGNVLIGGADLIELSSYDHPRVHNNTFRGFRFAGGVAIVHIGGLGGGFDPCVGASVLNNKFIDCACLSGTIGHAGLIVIDGTAATNKGFVVEGNSQERCYGFGGADDAAFIRIIGTTDPGGHTAQAITGSIGVNHHRSSGVAHALGTAVKIDSTVVSAQDIRVGAQDVDPSMTTPYIFAVLPKLTGPSIPTFGGGGGANVTAYAGSPENHVAAPVGTVCIDISTPALYQKQTGTGNTGWALAGGTSTPDATTSTKGIIQLAVDLDNTAAAPHVKHLTGTGGSVGISAATILAWDSSGAQIENASGGLRLRATNDVLTLFAGDGTNEICHWQYASGHAFARWPSGVADFSFLWDQGTSQTVIFRLAGTTPAGMFFDVDDFYWRTHGTVSKGRFNNTGARFGDGNAAVESVDCVRITLDNNPGAPSTHTGKGTIYLGASGELRFKDSGGTDHQINTTP